MMKRLPLILLFSATICRADGPISGSRSSVTPKGAIQKIYNVKDYGAVGDGSTDDTAAIASANADALAAGGGKVWFPKSSSYYKVTSAYTLPHDSGLTSLTWEGEFAPLPGYNLTGQPGGTANASTGVVIKSTGATIVKGWSGTPGGDFSNIRFVARNLVFRTIDNPTNDAVDLRGNSRNEIENCVIDTGVTGDAQTVPTNGAVALRMAARFCEAQVIRSLVITGYAVGIEMSEHVDASNIWMIQTLVGIKVLEGGNDNFITRICAVDIPRVVQASGGPSNLYISDFRMEVAASETPWSQVYNIDDPNSYITGAAFGGEW